MSVAVVDLLLSASIASQNAMRIDLPVRSLELASVLIQLFDDSLRR